MAAVGVTILMAVRTIASSMGIETAIAINRIEPLLRADDFPNPTGFDADATIRINLCPRPTRLNVNVISSSLPR